MLPIFKNWLKRGIMKRINKNKNTFISFIKTQIYFSKLIYKEHPKSFILYFVLSLLISLIPPILIILNKEMIDAISTMGDNPDNYKIAVSLLIVYFLLQYFSAVIKNLLGYIFTKITQTVNFILKKLMISKLFIIPLSEYEDSIFFDTINLANVALRGNGVKVTSNVIGIISSLISLFGILGILLSIHWLMPIALFFSTLPGIVLIFIAKTKKYKTNKKTSPTERELGFTESLFLNKNSIKEIKIFNLGNYLIEKWSKLFKQVQKYNLDLALWESKTESIAVLILNISSFGVSLLLINQIQNNNLSIGSYVALLGAVTAVQGIFASIGGNLGSIFETAIYNSALMKILNYEEKGISIKESVEIQQIDSISIENVSFYYPKSNYKVLDNVTLKINRGEKISILGYNGSGKTTLANCILGLYDVSEGLVNVNGINLTRIEKTKYFEKISAIFQDFYRYKYSVRENIGFGDLKKLDDDQELYKLLQKVELYEKVKNYQYNLDTYLTKELSEGSELSGGEWQRIAIARGFLKDSDLIILDEPTASLDPITEMKIFEIFNNLSETKTTITISHRIGPTKLSDRIIVMNKGKIVEEGTFNELMNKRGLYYEMYISQSKWYENEDNIIEEGAM